MINGNLSLDVGSNIRINRVRFVVDGYIVFMDCNDTRWTEYKLKSSEESKVRWLSVDVLNNEYAIYSEEFSQENIEANGYKEVDSRSAKVVDYSGNVDVDLNDQVFYKEYEDNTEELLISIENWNNEYEFSKGYYIDKDDIEKLDLEFDNIDNKYILDKVNRFNTPKKQKINLGIIIMIILIPIFLIFGLSNNKQDNSLSKFISSDSNFQYETSITSDLDDQKKADVYSTNKTIEEEGFSVIPYHVEVPTFGDWGFQLVTKAPIDTKDIKLDIETKFLDSETIDRLFKFSKDEIVNKDDIITNTLVKPQLLKYYLEAVNVWR